MKLTQYYLDCLSQASYLIGDATSGVAVVVDPRRDVAEYVRDAAANGLRITHIVETHFHADFLSGHLELAAQTGAAIVYGEGAPTDFPSTRVTDGERLPLGEVVLEFRHTPGHTPESISVVVWEHASDDAPYAVLTGDTLFIGDVGRPDLLSSVGISASELASQLYDSLHDKLMTLPDATLLYPAHGAGSSCGKNLSTETVCTIGEQRRTNYALQPMSREQFIETVTAGQPTAPGYFGYDAELNRRGHDLLEAERAATFSLSKTIEAQDAGAIVIDIRDQDSFAAGHLRGSVNVGADGRFAEYVGTMLDPETPIVIIAPIGAAEEARIRLGRIGYDNVIGALEGAERTFVDHPAYIDRASRITAAALTGRLADLPDAQLIDVRGPGERAAGAIPGSLHIPMAEFRERADDLDRDSPVVIHCATGYRSSIAASWLRACGFDDVTDVIGGYTAWALLTPVNV